MENDQPRKVPWLANKRPNPEAIFATLQDSIQANQFTNGGPCVKKLENELAEYMGVGVGRSVVAVVNGAAAIHALVGAMDMKEGRRLTYATQAFTFPSSGQGPLAEEGRCRIVDVDVDGGIDLAQVDALSPPVDGIFVTNILGNLTDLNRYTEWAKEKGKVLFFDNAATALSTYGDQETNACNFGDGCIISLHHTKPIGFGEGGAIVVPTPLEPYVRRAINFGYDLVKMDCKWHPCGNNGKMSDVAASFALSYVAAEGEKILKHHALLYDLWSGWVKEESADLLRLFPNRAVFTFPACIAVLFPRRVEISHPAFEGVVVRKYYIPLVAREDGAPVAWDFFDRIICFPCHVDVTVEMARRMFESAIQVARELKA